MIKLNTVLPEAWPQEVQDHLRYISSAIVVALSPWNPGKITYYRSNYGDPFSPSLTVETELLPRLPFSHQLDMLHMDEHQALCHYADLAYEWFFYRHTPPIEDHIILGTD
jgi:hypothetical protein